MTRSSEFNNLDDILQHHGVKGMKWGVRKSKSSTNSSNKSTPKKGKYDAIKERGRADKEVSRKRRNGEITRKQASQQRLENFHKYQSNNSIYKKRYEKRIAKGQSHEKAIRGAYKDLRRIIDTPISVAQAANNLRGR